MSLLRLVVDPGGSSMTGILDLDSFNSELILMEPEVATAPRENLKIYEQILIGESNPENSAWIEYEQKCLAVW
ncbi:hypothetical protein H6G93_37155 [Nostoc sp. FACHB-973]|nr:hypothetical protein [Nostoc sp. FACHB-973]